MSQYDSGNLPIDQHYTLGGYDFSITISHLSDEHATTVTASMVHNGQRTVQGIELAENAQIESWRVEATDDEAIVYVNNSQLSLVASSTVRASINNKTIQMQMKCVGSYSEYASFQIGSSTKNQTITFNCSGSAIEKSNNYGSSGIVVSLGKTGYHRNEPKGGSGDVGDVGNFAIESAGSYSITGSGYLSFSFGYVRDNVECDFIVSNIQSSEPSGDKILVGRFSIDIGDDPTPEPPDTGDDWEEPESTGDPDYTLKVKIIGALSGRHNDPLHDASLSFSPADQISVKGYGGGGDGGHGGGGGAGASTIIVRRFVTDKAGSIEVTAISKRHGYGSGGGKGGRGGDGCILVFY